MITLTATARCLRCDWTAGPGQWDDIQRQADKQLAPGHPTAVTAVPPPADRNQRT